LWKFLNQKHRFVCGVVNPVRLKLLFFQSSSGEMTTETVISEKYQGYPGVAHSGVAAAMLLHKKTLIHSILQ
jgi:hypothetical protein